MDRVHIREHARCRARRTTFTPNRSHLTLTSHATLAATEQAELSFELHPRPRSHSVHISAWHSMLLNEHAGPPPAWLSHVAILCVRVALVFTQWQGMRCLRPSHPSWNRTTLRHRRRMR